MNISKNLLIFIAIIFISFFVVIPIVSIFYEALANGIEYYISAISNEGARSSIKLTLLVCAISVPLNVVFGVCAAWCIAKFEFFGKNLDVILSDMAADTTGNKSLDCIRTNQLCADVIKFSSKILKPGGVLVSKLFMGEDFLEVKELAKSRFKKVQFFKPEASRDESKETYLHCAILKTL